MASRKKEVPVAVETEEVLATSEEVVAEATPTKKGEKPETLKIRTLVRYDNGGVEYLEKVVETNRTLEEYMAHSWVVEVLEIVEVEDEDVKVDFKDFE